MPHIPLVQHLPGITGLLEYRQDSATPIRGLSQLLLRGPSTLTEGDRELIAALVSSKNQCVYCTTAHSKAADILLGETNTCQAVIHDIDTAPINNKMKALLSIAALVQINGNRVTNKEIRIAKEAGASDKEIHDTVLISALFCLYNKYVDGLDSICPKDPAYFDQLGERITTVGYNRLSGGYEHLRNK